MSTPDQTRMLADLGRTVAQAGYDTLVETWKLRRLLAAAELAEADLNYERASLTGAMNITEVRRAHFDARDAYKIARVAR